MKKERIIELKGSKSLNDYTRRWLTLSPQIVQVQKTIQFQQGV